MTRNGFEQLKNLKHESGSLQTWLQKFDDAVEECETMGVVITDETKRIYLMKNLNKKIFEQTLVLWHGVLTRATFLQLYDACKVEKQPKQTRIKLNAFFVIMPDTR